MKIGTIVIYPPMGNDKAKVEYIYSNEKVDILYKGNFRVAVEKSDLKIIK